MTSQKEQFYIQRIATLEKQVAELLKVNAELAEKVAKLSKNSSNSSKPPSSDIVKPAKPKPTTGSARQGGQLLQKLPRPRARSPSAEMFARFYQRASIAADLE